MYKYIYIYVCTYIYIYIYIDSFPFKAMYQTVPVSQVTEATNLLRGDIRTPWNPILANGQKRQHRA